MASLHRAPQSVKDGREGHQYCAGVPSLYRNEETAVSGVPYAKKILPICSSVSSATNLRLFLSFPIRHIAEVGCAQLRASCGTNMPHWGHQGWDCLPSPMITMLSRGCLCAKCTRRFVREAAVPWHPSTGHLNPSRMVGKDTQYCAGVPSLSRLSPPPPPNHRGGGGVASPRPTLCCRCRWAASEPAARLTPHSGQCTLWRSLSLYESPCPVTRRV